MNKRNRSPRRYYFGSFGGMVLVSFDEFVRLDPAAFGIAFKLAGHCCLEEKCHLSFDECMQLFGGSEHQRRRDLDIGIAAMVRLGLAYRDGDQITLDADEFARRRLLKLPFEREGAGA